jgi:hypothetical protein
MKYVCARVRQGAGGRGGGGGGWCVCNSVGPLMACLHLHCALWCPCCGSAGNLILVNVANVACGFYGMRVIDVPLFLCFRRTSVAFALVMEFLMFKRTPAAMIVLAVGLSVVGALVAGAPVMKSNWIGIMWMFGNNTFTALSLTMQKQFCDANVGGPPPPIRSIEGPRSHWLPRLSTCSQPRVAAGWSLVTPLGGCLPACLPAVLPRQRLASFSTTA